MSVGKLKQKVYHLWRKTHSHLMLNNFVRNVAQFILPLKETIMLSLKKHFTVHINLIRDGLL